MVLNNVCYCGIIPSEDPFVSDGSLLCFKQVFSGFLSDGSFLVMPIASMISVFSQASYIIYICMYV